MSEQIKKSLTQLFETHRIVIWCDEKSEQRAEFEALTLPNVEKVEIDGNEFGLKYRVLRREPKQKFLLYREGQTPPDRENWLLDIELSHGQFLADQSHLWLYELGLSPLEYGELAIDHADFFKAEDRRARLKAMRPSEASVPEVRLKMVAACAGTEDQLDQILEALLGELAEERDGKIKQITRFGLADHLWSRVARQYGYQADEPSVINFALTLFENGYRSGVDEAATLHNEGVIFLRRWKNNRLNQSAFEVLSARFAEMLEIKVDLVSRSYRDVAQLDYFEVLDHKILPDLAQEVTNRTLTAGAVTQLIRRRRQGHWHERYKNEYECIEQAAHFLALLGKVDLHVHSLAQGVSHYCEHWYQLDQLYRKVIYHAQASGQFTILEPLLAQVENHYNNSFLLPLNDSWQQWVDRAEQWQVADVLAQQDFFAQRVLPFLQREKKVFVIISDALRYEVGDELARRMRQEDRYEATLDPALTLLPSFTQLGMAALLPHDEIEIDANETVKVDGANPQGTANRKKILERRVEMLSQTLGGDALQADVMLASNFLEMNREASRALFSSNDVVYIYHNWIDAIGDKLGTEGRAFEAVEIALNDLVKVIKKAVGANVTNLLVTADHGFIYQHSVLDESEFSTQAPEGEAGKKARRYVLGDQLWPSDSFKHFTAAAVGLSGEAEMLIPKSINRLRVRGAGSRYVHGGAALQEVVIPVVQINKSRSSDVTLVEVDILQRDSSNVISTGQITVRFYQREPVTDKVQARHLRAGLYTEAGDLISDQHEIAFDLTSEDAREREMRMQFVLTKEADAANGQEVLLKLEESAGAGTNHFTQYQVARYMLRRTFTSDFDF